MKFEFSTEVEHPHKNSISHKGGFTPLEVWLREIDHVIKKSLCCPFKRRLQAKNFVLKFFAPGLLTGFTLLETLVSIAFVTAALIGPVSLVVRGTLDLSFAKNKLIALNLAQEGIELVRLTRENNILCDSLDGGGIDGSRSWRRRPGGGSGGPAWDPGGEGVGADYKADASAANFVDYDCGAIEFSAPDLDNNSPLDALLIDSNGLYQYDTGSPSVFRRRITLDSRSVPPGAGPLDRVEITSEVTWTERGTNRSVVLSDVLYNWK